MAMDLERLRTFDIAPVEQAHEARDTILYALGVGYGADPLNESELPFVYEGRGLRAVPTYCHALCYPDAWTRRPEFGIDAVKVVDAEQHLTMHAPMPPATRMRAEYRIAGIEDKGAGRGALLHLEKRLFDTQDGAPIATIRATWFLRGNGGEGGFGTVPAPTAPLPDRAPDRVTEIATLPRQALIYRLSGDWNPLHVDPDVAHAAGFDRPILHGLCTMGIACRALVRDYCGNDPARLREMFVRFSSPVFPGETIRLEFFEEGGGALRFRALVKERGAVVLDRGSARVG